MKVTDAEILRAIWLSQVKRTAKGVIDNYVGGNKGLKGDRDQDRHFAQYQSMISRGNLGIPLSNGQLARRLKALIGSHGLKWRDGRQSSYEFMIDTATDVFRFAREWWAARGVPSGFDDVAKCMRTARVDDFDGKVAQLESELLERFGNLEVTP